MRFTTIKNNESDLSALMLRLYPNLSDDARKQVESSLLKANPHLAELNAFKAGIMVRIPYLPDLKIKPVAASNDPVEYMVGQLRDAIQEHQAILSRASKERKDELGNQKKNLENKEVAEAIKKSPEAKELAKQLSISLSSEKKKLEEKIKTRNTLFKQLTEDLESLLG